MPECELVHQSERCTAKDRNLAAGLQPAASAQFAGLLAARRVCTNTSGDTGMRKASTRLLEQGIQAPSPTPDLIPAETKTSTENLHWDWTANGGTSPAICRLCRWSKLRLAMSCTNLNRDWHVGCSCRTARVAF